MALGSQFISHVMMPPLRLLLPWLGALLIHTFNVDAQMISAPTMNQYPKRHYNAGYIDCRNITEIVFLSFFPCLRNDYGFDAPESIRECDLLAEAAAQLAVDRVNEDPTILPNITLQLYPVYVPSGKGSLTVSLPIVIRQHQN